MALKFSQTSSQKGTAGGRMKREFSITGGAISFYTIPTDAPEADGTISWDSTSMVLVRNSSAERTQALGYTYADAGTAAVADMLLKKIVLGSDPLRHAATWQQMLRQVRNLGETGIAMMAVSAIDNALWDLAARLLDVPLVSLLGQVRTGHPGLRQRWLYYLYRPPAYRSARRLGCAGVHQRQDEDRDASGSRPGPSPHCAAGHRLQLQSICRCEWRLHGNPSHRACPSLRG